MIELTRIDDHNRAIYNVANFYFRRHAMISLVCREGSELCALWDLRIRLFLGRMGWLYHGDVHARAFFTVQTCTSERSLIASLLLCGAWVIPVNVSEAMFDYPDSRVLKEREVYRRLTGLLLAYFIKGYNAGDI